MFERLAAAAVARIADRVGNRLVLVATQVLGHLGVQRPFHQQLCQLLEPAPMILDFPIVE